MSQAFYAILTFLVGGLFGYLIAKKTIGERRWHDGYLHGFNFAWDEKAKLDKLSREKHMKDIRRKSRRFQVIKGDKA